MTMSRNSFPAGMKPAKGKAKGKKKPPMPFKDSDADMMNKGGRVKGKKGC